MGVDGDTGSADARRLRPDALETLRRKAVAAVEAGIPQAHVARLYGVSRKTVGNWMRAYQEGGEGAFRPRRRGRRVGQQLALSASQQGWVIKTIASGAPHEVDLPSLLWTRKALGKLIHRQFEISLSAGTIDQYLSRWELTSRTGPFARLDECEPGTMLVAWTRPRSPEGDERRHALVAVNHRGMLFFLASEQAYTGEQITDFGRRLRVQLGVDVRLLVRSWPSAHLDVLNQWHDADHDVATV